MPNVEDEICKLQDEIDRFLREEHIADDDGDDDGEVAPSVPRPRPGAITPLGVRVDRGDGLLGANGATATIDEMDSVLSNIRAWKQKHEREMLELRKRNEAVLSELEAPGSVNCSAAGGATSSAAQPLPGPAAVLMPPGPGSSAASGGSGATDDPLLRLGQEVDEELQELLQERRERQERTCPGGGLFSQLQYQQQHHAQQREQSGGQAMNGPLAAGPGRPLPAGLSSTPWSTDGQLLIDSLAGPMHRPVSDVLPRPSTAARKRAEAAAEEAVLRGQQLMAQLEAELRELEGLGGGGGSGPASTAGGGGANGSWAVQSAADPSSADDDAGVAGSEPPLLDPLLDWSAQLQSVLAKLDALQTGYQVTASAAASTSAVEPAAAGGRLPSGGQESVAAPSTGPDLFLAPRPGSARLRLEPLPLAQKGAAAAAVAVGKDAGGIRGGAALLGGGSATAPAGTSKVAVCAGPAAPAKSGVEDDGGQRAAEAVPCAGHRMRQLRQLKRRSSGNGSSGGGGSEKER